MTIIRPSAGAQIAAHADTQSGDYVITVRDELDARIAGHAGGVYVSPPQSRADALALVGLLLGGNQPRDDGDDWTLAVAGGRRKITLTRRTP